MGCDQVVGLRMVRCSTCLVGKTEAGPQNGWVWGWVAHAHRRGCHVHAHRGAFMPTVTGPLGFVRDVSPPRMPGAAHPALLPGCAFGAAHDRWAVVPP